MSLFTPHIKLGKYSSADVERWKKTNIVVLHVSIKNNKSINPAAIKKYNNEVIAFTGGKSSIV